MPLILGTNSIKDTGFDVANSLRFNDGSSDHLSRSISSTSNRRTYTISTWFKRGSMGANQKVITAGTAGQEAGLQFYDGSTENTLRFYEYTGSNNIVIAPNRLLRDPSAWYHVVIGVDTTQSTESNRVKYYLNGVQETSFATATYPSQNYDTKFNTSGSTNYIGFLGSHSAYFDGYMAETVLVDGQQLDATSFGEFDSDSPNIWKPKDVSGLTFGTNGFYLDYEDSSALGNDAAGSNNFTVNNLTAIDQTTDTCTNNFATLNPLYNQYADPTFSEGNLKITVGSGWSGAKATMGVSTGKWYWEVKLSGTMSSHIHGVQQENVNEGAQNPQNTTGTTSFYNHDGGEVNTDGSNTTADYGTLDDGDILGIALDMDAGSYGQITFYDNGSAIASNINLSSSSTLVMPHFSIDNSTVECNFGNPPYAISSGNADGNGYGNFEYAVPSGYYSLCTKNLAEFG